ncbi:MAG: tetratricopeptide repeat protein [Candidatus Gastranaerophilales bacterium]|nr:tetratricopeptide repeat protein [Candidatus Gastranaerophilales bacterium]
MENTEELIQNRKYAEALNALENHRQLQPDNTEVLSKIGYCLSMTGKINDAEKYFKQASKRCDNAQTWQQYGYILYQLGKLTESIKAIKNAIKLDSKDILNFHQLAFLFSKKGDFEKSLYYIDKAINIEGKAENTGSVDLLIFKAGIYENINKDLALDIYFSLIERFEDDPFSYDKTANIVIDRFNFSKALNNLNSTNSEYNNATLLLRNGHTEKAVKLYKKIIKEDKHCYPAYLGIAQALYEKKFGIVEIEKVNAPVGISELFRNYNQLNDFEKNIINASVAPFANFIGKLNSQNSQFVIVPVDVKLVDYPDNSYLCDKDYQNMPFSTLRGIGGDNGYVGVERLRDILWDIPDNIPFKPACAAHEYAHLVWCLLDSKVISSFKQLYNESKKNNSFISNYSKYNVEEFFAEYYAYYVRMLSTNKPVPDNPVIKLIQSLQD